jgi:hypothetical protein
MSAIQRISDRVALADIVALDRDDQPVVVVAAANRMVYPQELPAYREVLSAIRKDIPFAILAFADEMTIYRKRRTRPLEPLVTLPSREVIRFYSSRFASPGFAEGPLFKDYIVTKLREWLEDFMMHWKSPTPPLSEMMTSLGLAGRLEGGRTKERVRLACLPVRGDQLPPELRDREEPWGGSDPLEPSTVPPTDHAERLPDGSPSGL